MTDPVSFFDEKHDWSKYKDAILDYYLVPYLAKVAKLGRPILIVDCFAGAGRFSDGSPGSPLIIGKRLTDPMQRGTTVQAIFVESESTNFARLRESTKQLAVPFQLHFGSFRELVKEIADRASQETVLLYVDPIKPTDLLFDDLASIYDRIHEGTSVETFINLLSTGFVRGTDGLFARRMKGAGDDLSLQKQINRWNRVAGGDYWQSILQDAQLNQQGRIESFANAYGNQLRRWFDWTIVYPIREKYHHVQPKYHLVFGSRYDGAFELMNRAMVKARREFVGAEFCEGMLFENQPPEEVVDQGLLQIEVERCLQSIGTATWKRLRLELTRRHMAKFTDSEINQAIKALIKSERANSAADGSRVLERAAIRPR